MAFVGGLPPVGATATLLGVAAFQNSANAVARSLTNINNATQNLGRVTASSWATVSSSAGLAAGAYVRSTGLILAATAAVAGAIKGLGTSADFQQTFKNIEVISNSSTQDINRLSESTLELSRRFGILPNVVGQANTALTKGGISIREMEQGATQAVLALERATLGEINLARGAELVIQGMNQYSLSAKEAIRVTNTITGAANSSTASVEDLASGFKQAVIPIQVKAQVEEVGAALAILNDNALRGEVAGTSLRNMFLRLLDPSKEALEIMKRYNISIFDSQGRSVGFRNVLLQIINAFKETGNAATDAQKAFDQASLFGARQGSAASVFARTGIEEFDTTVNNLRENVDAVRQAERQLETFNGQLDRVKASVVALITEGFTPLTTSLQPVVTQMANLIAATSGEGLGRGLLAISNGFKEIFAATEPVRAGLFLVGEALYRTIAGITGNNDVWAIFIDVLQRVSRAVGLVLAVIAELINILVPLSGAIVQSAKEWAFLASTISSAVGDVILPHIGTLVNALPLLPITMIRIVKDTIAAMDALIMALGGYTVVWQELWFVKIAGTVLKVVNFVIESVGTLLNALDALVPAFAKLSSYIDIPNDAVVRAKLAEIDASILTTADIISKAIPAAVPAAQNAMANLAASVATFTKNIADNTSANLGAAVDRIRAFAAAVNTLASSEENARALAEQRAGERGGGSTSRPRISVPEFPSGSGGLLFPTAGGGGGAPSGPSIAQLSKQIQAQLADIPGAGKSLGDFLAGIAKDAPGRLAPMIAAIRAVKTQIAQTTIAARNLARTNAAIAASNKRLAVLQAAAGRIEIAQALAVIGYDKQLLALRHQIQAIDVQMFPLRDRMEDLDRQIAKLNYDNLELVREQLKLNLEMLPIKAQIEDIDRKIADLQKPQLDAQKKIAEIELRMLPFQQQRAELEARITELQRTDYGLVQRRLQLEIQALPIRQAMQRLEREISRIHTDDLRLTRQRLEQEVALLGPRREIAALEREITNLVSRQVGLTRTRDELVAEQSIALLEDELAGLQGTSGTDERQNAIAEQIAAETTALEALRRANENAARAEEIKRLGLEITKATIEDTLQPQIDQLAIIREQEEAFGLLAELQKLTYEEQQRNLQNILFLYDGQILAIDQLVERQTLNNELEIAFLQERQQMIDIFLAARQREIDLIQAQIDLQAKNNEITIIGLEQERQALEAALKPLEQKLAETQRLAEAERLRNQIQITFLEAERRALIDQLKPLEDKRRALEREIQVVELQRAAVAIQFEEQKLAIQELILQEQLKRADLELTRMKEQEVFEALALEVFNAILNSKEFTTEEAVEVTKRINLWNDEIDAVQKRVTELKALEEDAAKAAAILFGQMVDDVAASTGAATGLVNGYVAETNAAIASIPREINIIVRYTTIGGPGPSGGGRSGGGTAEPGGTGGDTPAPAPGGDGGGVPPGNEPTTGTDPNAGSLRRAVVLASGAAVRTAQVTIDRSTRVNVNASYANTQSPVQVKHDIAALLAQSRR